MGRPSHSWPPSTMKTGPRTIPASRSGQSQNGGREALAGRPTRTAATRARPDPVSTAFVKWVVPITTRETRPVSAPSPSTPRSAVNTPEVTSSVVRALISARTFPPRISTASVWVPPTSTPTRARSGKNGISAQHRVRQPEAAARRATMTRTASQIRLPANNGRRRWILKSRHNAG